MNWIEIVTWGTLALIPAFMLLDLTYRARKFKTDSTWRLRATLVTIGIIGLSFVAPALWFSLVGEASLFDLSGLGTLGGAVAGILVYELLHYGYHRAVHKSDRLWRWFHQMHHSAESLDAFGAYFISPTDAFMFISLGTLTFAPGLGLTPEAAVLANLFLTFNAMFQHANIKTPQWLGYIIQRPESHGVHHQRGVHRYNYSDLPLWDILFGTFRNPREFEAEVGLYDGASRRIGSMLIGRDVLEPELIELDALVEEGKAA